jgi:GNAT superfamily N-acetyltransferase
MTATPDRLGPRDLEALRALLARDPRDNLYLLGILEEFGLDPSAPAEGCAYYGRFARGELVAGVFVGGSGGLVIPVARDFTELGTLCEALAPNLDVRAVQGDKLAVEVLLKYLGGRKPKLTRTQRLFAVSADDLGPFTNPTLRPATEDDLPRLLPMAAATVRELFERDPLREDPEGFRARVLQRIRGRRTYVLEEGDALVFKIEVGARSKHGAELEGLYTAPEVRRRGHATLSLGQISRHLLSSLPRLTLRVDDRDPSLAGLARKVGFVPGRPQKLVVFE